MSKKSWYSVVAVLMIAATVLSACGTPATPTEAPAPAATEAPAATAMPPAATAAPQGSTQVEVFSWWVGPGEADGLAAMVKVFNAKYPNIKFVNAAVAGGSGTNAQAVLATRLAAGD